MTRIRIGRLMLALFVLGLSALSSGGAPRAREQAAAGDGRGAGSSLVGVARAMDGKPMEGVTVSARGVEKSYTTSVFTDERGEYVFPPLGGGRYEVWAQAVGFVYSWSRFSAIFTSLLIGLLLNRFGVSGVFVFVAAAMIVAALAIGMFGPRTSGLALEAIAD